jgi:hypothetical protein
MDIRKIIKRVLLEAEGQESSGFLPNWSGVNDLPSSFGGAPLENIVTVKSIPNIETYNIGWFETACTKYMELPNNKYPDLKSCVYAQKRALLDQMEVGGVRSFTWKGQSFTACVKRNDKLQYSTFSGYYGSTSGEGQCYAPEFYYMMSQKKYESKKDSDSPGTSSDKTITLTGPDYQ